MTVQNCPACNSRITADAKYCPKCGTALTDETAAERATPENKTRDEGLRLRDVYIVLGIIAVFSVGFFTLKPPGERPQPQGTEMSGIPGHDVDMAAVANLPTDFEGLLSAGNREMDNGNYLLATEAYRRALALQPGSVDVRTDYGACLYAMGLPERALQEFYAVLGASPAHPIAHFNMGIVYHSVGQADSAASYFRRYLDIDPHGASAPTARQLLETLEG